MAIKGSHLSPETKRKISLANKRLFEQGKLKLPDNTGNSPWNKNKKMSTVTKQKISLTKKGNSPAWNKNKPWSKVVRDRISASKKGSRPWNKNIPRTPEEKKRMSEGARRMWARRKKLV